MSPRRHHAARTAALAMPLLLAAVLPVTAASADGRSVQVLSVGPEHGVKPVLPQTARSPFSGTSGPLILASTANPGAVSVTPTVYLVFWGSQWSSDPAGAAPALTAFFTNVGGTTNTWTAITTQYCSGPTSGITTCGTGTSSITQPASVLAGVWYDSATASPNRPSTSQLAAEAANAAAHFGAPVNGNGNAQYVIASAHGVVPKGFGTQYCGWHSSASTSVGEIAFTNLPYVPDLGAGACTTLATPGVLDGYFSTETHEYAETVTDLWPSRGWLTKNGQEIGDLCVALDATLTLGGTAYDVQGLWSNAANACVTHA